MCNQGSMRLSTRYRLVPAPSKEISRSYRSLCSLERRSSRSLKLRSQFPVKRLVPFLRILNKEIAKSLVLVYLSKEII